MGLIVYLVSTMYFLPKPDTSGKHFVLSPPESVFFMGGGEVQSSSSDKRSLIKQKSCPFALASVPCAHGFIGPL